jgi:hypothetical protein
MPADAQELCRMYDTLKQQRQPWMSTWQAIADVSMPAMNDIEVYRQPGDIRTYQLFDNTGLVGSTLLASHMAGAVTNFQMRWFELRMEADPLNEIKSVAVWLDAAAKTMQDKLSATTTPQSFHEKYLQFGGFGTGALFTDEHPTPDKMGKHGLISRSLPIGTYCVAEDANGQVDTLYRELELSPRQAAQHFGYANLPERTKLALEQADTRHSPTSYLHCVYPRSDVERDPSNENQRNMPFASAYIDLTQKTVVSEGGYRWFPFMVSRWQKLRTWSPWGFGPGHIALPEMLTLNRMDRDILKALQIHILPPYWTDDPDAVGRVLLLPGMVNPIAFGRQIQPMRGPGDFNISHLGLEDRRQRVRQAFFTDQLLSLPPPDQSTQMTAYEVGQRIAYMARLMGPAFMRLLSEFLNPFIDITFGIMLENDELPEPPDELIIAAANGYGTITVDYQGPLARAQRGDEVAAIEGTLTMAERYFKATGDVEIYDNFDKDELIRRSGKVYGVPATVLRDKEEVAQIRKERDQAAAQAQQQQEALAATEGLKNITPTLALAQEASQPEEVAA